MMPRETIEAAIIGQIGHPAASMIASTTADSLQVKGPHFSDTCRLPQWSEDSRAEALGCPQSLWIRL
jgi:hypothetical protein